MLFKQRRFNIMLLVNLCVDLLDDYDFPARTITETENILPY